MADLPDDLSVINEALARIGGAPLFALDEETKRASAVIHIYRTVVPDAFAAHRWHWARRTAPLDRLAVTPETGWRFAYALPGDRIGAPVKVLDNPRCPDLPLRDYIVEGGELHCDREAVWATCVRAVPPAAWEPAFRQAVIVALAATFCLPETHDTKLQAVLEQTAWGSPSEGRRGGLMGRAIALDAASAGAVASAVGSDPLTASHFGGGGAWF